MRKLKVPSRETITSDTPLRLETAAQLAFPDNSIGVQGLRNEIAKGRLPAEKIAGKIYVTLGGIEEMRKQCRLPANSIVSGSAKKTPTTDSVPTQENARIAYLHLMQQLDGAKRERAVAHARMVLTKKTPSKVKS